MTPLKKPTTAVRVPPAENTLPIVCTPSENCFKSFSAALALAEKSLVLRPSEAWMVERLMVRRA